MSTPNKLAISGTGPADAQVKQMKPEDFGGQDPREWHDRAKVRKLQARKPKLATATKATIRPKPERTDGSTLVIKWTGPADGEVKGMKPEDFGGQDPREWHEAKVREFQARKPTLATATKATIRKPEHTGGSDPDEAPHITVTFTQGKKVISSPPPFKGAWHVYTRR